MIEKWRGEGGEEKEGIVRIILFLWMDSLGRIGLEKERDCIIVVKGRYGKSTEERW